MAGVDLGNAWGPAVWEDGVWAIPGAWASDGGGETLVLCSSVSSGQLLDEFVEVTDGNSYDASVSGQEVLSQSWTAGSDPTELVRACMRMRLRGSPTGTLSVEIRAHTGTYGTSSEPTGAALVASADFDVSTLTTGYLNYSFALSGWTPSASTQYTLVLDMRGVSAPDVSNTVQIPYEISANATHGGNAAQSADGSAWTTVSNIDIPFKLYETGGDDFELRFRDATYRRRYGGLF